MSQYVFIKNHFGCWRHQNNTCMHTHSIADHFDSILITFAPTRNLQMECGNHPKKRPSVTNWQQQFRPTAPRTWETLRNHRIPNIKVCCFEGFEMFWRKFGSTAVLREYFEIFWVFPWVFGAWRWLKRLWVLPRSCWKLWSGCPLTFMS